MRINVDRLCELAGVSDSRRSRGGLIREAADYGSKEEYGDINEMPPELERELEANEEAAEDSEANEEVIEVDEKDLVKELRRMRIKMHEARKIQKRRKQNLQEAQLKAIIDQEVKNVLKELNLNSGWIYGNQKPTKSRQGYTHQGAYLKGLGFK